jgi:hypothetical protein
VIEKVEINGKKYEVHVSLGSDCGYSQGQQCAFLDNPSCDYVDCCSENRPDKQDVIFVEVKFD